MKFVSLRIAGFKSFVEPVDIPILDGLTGIVGPNGCGKSNLVEAIRWVMGENSYKNMRASGMDDVIFAGTTARPARNAAEVTITIDNHARKAPSAFNGADSLAVSRRIERGAGSTYRINGSEVRARDVQLLFADAASGARSPALVRQGQIAELISAKPQARRRILEDAAGISGLYARRHEAEIRLKSAEANLLRVNDLLREMSGQLEALRRQSRHAVRYRTLSAAIARHEGLLLYRRFIEAHDQRESARSELVSQKEALDAALTGQNAALTEQAVSIHAVQGLREGEARAAAALARLASAADVLDAEERRASTRGRELDRQIEQIDADLGREAGLAKDAQSALEALAREEGRLQAAKDSDTREEAEAKAAHEQAILLLGSHEAALDAAMSVLASLHARRSQLERSLREVSDRLIRLTGQISEIESEQARLEANSGQVDPAPLAAAVEAAKAALVRSESQAGDAEAATCAARAAESQAGALWNDAEKTAQRFEVEIKTLKGVLMQDAASGSRAMDPLLSQIRVAPGYERALGAVLGEDLEASLIVDAPLHWGACGDAAADSPLPIGVQPFALHVEAPAVMARRLAQIGLVSAPEGARLAGNLAPGQRLVTLDGEVWRWDGLHAAPRAPSSVARKLSEKNRLTRIEADYQAAKSASEALRRSFATAQTATTQATAHEAACREAWRSAQRVLGLAQEQYSVHERQQAGFMARLSALAQARTHLTASLTEADAVKKEALTALSAVEDRSMDEAAVEAQRVKVRAAREHLGQCAARTHSFAAASKARSQRLDSIVFERASWVQRAAQAAAQLQTLNQRRLAAQNERSGLDELPGQLREKRLTLLSALGDAKARRGDAAAALAQGELRVAAADRAAKDAASALSGCREGLARMETRLEALDERCNELQFAILDLMQTPWTDLALRLELKDGQVPPPQHEIEAALEQLRRERERLGAVNLLAESELTLLEERFATLTHERDDLSNAIRRLRNGISGLNQEGRTRLLAAFALVNGHFQRLFTTLFGGGIAELVLSESDDPLEAGLEIIARPPGKKPQTMSLLSGGEQALTAMALIFSVFLTNPAPVCVLDEVDAPLDDHNVERFCALLEDMIHSASTRFLVITHNPITMARMHRLYGVTMAERGVSQLVSVDLAAAERIVEAA